MYFMMSLHIERGRVGRIVVKKIVNFFFFILSNLTIVLLVKCYFFFFSLRMIFLQIKIGSP